jgi:hypothetical protein
MDTRPIAAVVYDASLFQDASVRLVDRFMTLAMPTLVQEQWGVRRIWFLAHPTVEVLLKRT